ncbi:MAG TPA: Spy/CpxP family protein refolding chaperone [Prolixibacteraceae bacterium]|nr:Spy/CpxP family protein refolding chaperone [Prolixibacteraceae bacterium]
MKAKLLILAMLISVSSFMYAQPVEKGAMRPFHGPKGEVGIEKAERPMNGLNLTDAQKEEFKKSMMDMHKQMQPLRNELGEVEAHQKTLVSSDQPDFKAINKNIEKIGALKVEMAKLKTKHQLDMRAQLTDEQRMKFDLFQGKMEHKKGNQSMKHNMQRDRMN